jgi:hypothetical protein
LAYGSEFLGVRELLLRPRPFGNVLADRNHVGNFTPLAEHRDLADAILAARSILRALDAELLDPSRPEDFVELLLQQLPGLAMENVEDRSTERVSSGYALVACLAVSVPGANSIVPIDDVEPDRQRIYDSLGELAGYLREPGLSL